LTRRLSEIARRKDEHVWKKRFLFREEEIYTLSAARRQELSSCIIEILPDQFSANHPKVRFAVPSSMIRYRPDVAEKKD